MQLILMFVLLCIALMMFDKRGSFCLFFVLLFIFFVLENCSERRSRSRSVKRTTV